MSSSIVIDFLRQNLDNKSGLVYTYFDSNDKATQTGLKVLGSILRQLLEQLDPLQWPDNATSQLNSMRRDPLNSSHILYNHSSLYLNNPMQIPETLLGLFF